MNQPDLLFSSSPHVHSGASTSHIMESVIWALIPAAAFAVAIFGWPALLVILITVLSCLLSEYLFLKIRRRSAPLGDRSAALTGLLLALTLPPHSPWWLCVIGGVFAIVVGKQIHGGLGHNLFNPALISRVFLLISFPLELTTWPPPAVLFSKASYSLADSLNIIFPGWNLLGSTQIDSMSAATPLGQYRMEVGLGKTVQEALGGSYHFDPLAATGGLMGGSLGETSVILLLLGGMYLLYKRIITWHIPVAMLAGCLLPAYIFWSINPALYPDPFFHLITGGLMIGAFFMATDMVTSPVTIKGQIIFGLGCGLLTYIIRTWGGYPEGVSFAILIMNATSPLLDQYTRPKIYGQVKQG